MAEASTPGLPGSALRGPLPPLRSRRGAPAPGPCWGLAATSGAAGGGPAAADSPGSWNSGARGCCGQARAVSSGPGRSRWACFKKALPRGPKIAPRSPSAGREALPASRGGRPRAAGRDMGPRQKREASGTHCVPASCQAGGTAGPGKPRDSPGACDPAQGAGARDTAGTGRRRGAWNLPRRPCRHSALLPGWEWSGHSSPGGGGERPTQPLPPGRPLPQAGHSPASPFKAAPCGQVEGTALNGRV